MPPLKFYLFALNYHLLLNILYECFLERNLCQILNLINAKKARIIFNFEINCHLFIDFIIDFLLILFNFKSKFYDYHNLFNYNL